MKLLTDLTYLPDLSIDEKLECIGSRVVFSFSDYLRSVSNKRIKAPIEEQESHEEFFYKLTVYRMEFNHTKWSSA